MVKGEVKRQEEDDEMEGVEEGCHKLHSVISPPNLRRFPRS